MEPAVIPVWKLWTVYACMFAVTAILSCVIKIRGLFKSTKWRHFENVKFEALSARRVVCTNGIMLIQRHPNSHYDVVLLNGVAWGTRGEALKCN